MVPNVTSLEEAREFFLNNASGWCIGTNDEGEEKRLDSYQDAVCFF